MKIAKRISAIIAAGALAIGSAAAEGISIADLAQYTTEQLYTLKGNINFVLFSRDYDGNYISFDNLGRTNPLYVGDVTSWGYVSEERAGDYVYIGLNGVYSSVQELTEIGMPSYVLSSGNAYTVFKTKIYYGSDNPESHEQMSYNDFDVFTIDGARIGSPDYDNALTMYADVYAGSTGFLYVIVANPPADGCQIRYSLGGDKYMFMTSAQRPQQ